MAKLARWLLILSALLIAATACSSSDSADLSVPVDDSIPTTTQESDDPYRRVAGGVALLDAEGFLQLCFRLVDQEGAVLCADARATYAPDSYVSFDGSQVGMEELGELTASSEPAWLYEAEFDDGIHLELRIAGQGEVIQ